MMLSVAASCEHHRIRVFLLEVPEYFDTRGSIRQVVEPEFKKGTAIFALALSGAAKFCAGGCSQRDTNARQISRERRHETRTGLQDIRTMKLVSRPDQRDPSAT
jgi:hypothetical protein